MSYELASHKEVMWYSCIALAMLEFEITDVSIYTPVQGEGEVGIIAGFFPEGVGIAGLISLEVARDYSRYHLVWNLCGQLNRKGLASEELIIKDHDRFCHTESYDGDFTVQFRTNGYAEPEDQIIACFIFFRNFFEIEWNRKRFAPRFKKIPNPWTTPGESMEFQALAKKISEDRARDYYMARILLELPPAILPEGSVPGLKNTFGKLNSMIKETKK